MRASPLRTGPRAWGVAARCRSRAGRARYSARCNGPGPAYGAEVAIVDERRVSPLDAARGKAGIKDNRPSPEVAKILQTALGQ